MSHAETSLLTDLEYRGTYQVKTFGCQMNVHDSERLTGLLENAGYTKAEAGADPLKGEVDIVVFNTCAVRENADNRLYGNLGQLRPAKDLNPNLQIAVGGCLAQKDKHTITQKAPWVDVVFGTHNMGSLPVLLDRSRVKKAAQVEILESLEVFPSTLPTKRESVYAGLVSISVGCNNTCTFCIVPALRGKEKDRRPGDILAEVQELVNSGAIEVTLLGQNVNSYGVEFGDRSAFSKLLRACGEIEGLERVRFTSPHPAMFTDDVIEAMAQTPNVMPQLHMPLQSGSDQILKQMRRSYRSKKFLGILEKVRELIPHAAITTDLIVGFPGETEEDFEKTLEVVAASRFSSAYTFQYSPRPGTPAATMENQIPKEIVQERFERLVELQDQISYEENQKLLGKTVKVLVSESGPTLNAGVKRLSGRAEDGRLVHFAIPEDHHSAVELHEEAGVVDFGEASKIIRPGDIVNVQVSEAKPFFLIADSGQIASSQALGAFEVHSTRSSRSWEDKIRGIEEISSCGTGGSKPGGPVTLGIPSLRVGS